MKKLSNIIIALVVIFSILGTWKVTSYFKDKAFEEQRKELKAERIKNDSLVLINKGLYSKLVADTLTIKELKELTDSLELKLKNPEVVIVTKYLPKEIEKPVDGIVVKDSVLEIEDYYPSKEDPFFKYNSTINLLTEKGNSIFSFQPFDISIGVEQKLDGTYKLNTRLPEWLNVVDLDIRSLPLEDVRPDNFGVLVGAGIGRDFRDNKDYLILSGGVRFKKVYLELQGGTNSTISSSIKIEF